MVRRASWLKSAALLLLTRTARGRTTTRSRPRAAGISRRGPRSSSPREITGRREPRRAAPQVPRPSPRPTTRSLPLFHSGGSTSRSRSTWPASAPRAAPTRRSIRHASFLAGRPGDRPSHFQFPRRARLGLVWRLARHRSAVAPARTRRRRRSGRPPAATTPASPGASGDVRQIGDVRFSSGIPAPPARRRLHVLRRRARRLGINAGHAAGGWARVDRCRSAFAAPTAARFSPSRCSHKPDGKSSGLLSLLHAAQRLDLTSRAGARAHAAGRSRGARRFAPGRAARGLRFTTIPIRGVRLGQPASTDDAIVARGRERGIEGVVLSTSCSSSSASTAAA